MDNSTLSIVIKAQDQASKVFRGIQKTTGKVTNTFKKLDKTNRKMFKRLKSDIKKTDRAFRRFGQNAVRVLRNIKANQMGVGGKFGFGGATASIIGASGGLAVSTAIIQSSLDHLLEVEEAINVLRAFGADETFIDSIRESARTLSQEYGISAVEIVNAFEKAFSTGTANAEEAEKKMSVAIRTAKLGVSDLVTAYGVLNASSLNFGLSFEEASNTLIAASRQGDVKLKDFSGKFGTASVIIAEAGIKLSEFASGISLITNLGTPTAQAITNLKNAISSLSRRSAEAEELFKHLGVKTFPELIEKSGGMQNAFQAIIETAKEQNLNINKIVGSTEGLSAVTAIGKSNWKEYADILNVVNQNIGNTDGYVSDLNRLIGTNAERIKSTKEKWNDLKLEIGERFIPVLEEAMPLIEDIVGVLKTAITEMGRLVRGYNDLKEVVKSPKLIGETILETPKHIPGVNTILNNTYGVADNLGRRTRRGFNKTFGWFGEQIFGNYSGTNFWGGGRTLVGEQGPEIVDLPRGSRIHSNDDSKRMGGTTNNYFNINIDGSDAQTIVDILNRQQEISKQGGITFA